MVISPKRLPEVKNDSLARIVSFASGNSIDWKFVSGQVSEDGSCSADFEADAPKPKSKFRLHGEVSQIGGIIPLQCHLTSGTGNHQLWLVVLSFYNHRPGTWLSKNVAYSIRLDCRYAVDSSTFP